jgi:hypothetical protein
MTPGYTLAGKPDENPESNPETVYELPKVWVPEILIKIKHIQVSRIAIPCWGKSGERKMCVRLITL